MEYGLLGLLVLAADIYAIYQVLTSGASALAKVLWTLLIIVLPVVGFIIWLIAGPRSSEARERYWRSPWPASTANTSPW